jgi:hypothetical protein
MLIKAAAFSFYLQNVNSDTQLPEVEQRVCYTGLFKKK